MRRTTPPNPIYTHDGAYIELTRGCYALVDEHLVPKVQRRIWCTQTRGGINYAVANGGNEYPTRQIYLHQYLMDFPGFDIDHINHNGLDNRLLNLRVTDDRRNQANQRIRPGYTSRFKGVCKPKASNHWRASISVEGVPVYLGVYPTELEAAKAYNEAAIEYRGLNLTLNNLEGK